MFFSPLQLQYMLSLVFLLLALGAPPEAHSIAQLKDRNFHDFVTESGRFVIMFYSPSCGACQNAIPVFKRIASQFDDRDDVDMRTAMIDVSEHPASGDRYDIWHYPTILVDGDDFHYPALFDGDATSEQELNIWLGILGNPNYVPAKTNLWSLTSHSLPMCTQMPVCLVQFTDVRCIQCSARKSQIHEAANNVDKASYSAGVRIGQVDLSMSPEVGQQYNISLKGFVEHRVFSYGKMYNFYATDDWKGIVDYAVSWLKSPVTEIRNMTSLKDDFYMNEKSTAIALMLPERNTVAMEAFVLFAKSLRDTVKMFYVDDKALLGEMGVTKPKIVIKHYFEALTSAEPPYVEVPLPTNTPVNEDWFKTHFKANEFSLINHIDAWRRIKQVDDLAHHVGLYLDDPAWGFEELKQLKEELAPIAAKFSDRITFFVGDKAEVSTKFEEVDTINAKVPFLFLISNNLDRKYTPDLPELRKWEERSRADYLKYFESYLENYLSPTSAVTLPPKIKSDEDPGDHDGVIDVVGVSADRVFSELDKDVMLLVTSSNQCRSCKFWEDEFLNFGQKFANYSTLTVGMMNQATNELPRPLIMTADPPYIVLAPARRSSPYAGITFFFDEMVVENLKNWVQKEGGNPVFENGEQILAMDEIQEDPGKEPEYMGDDGHSGGAGKEYSTGDLPGGDDDIDEVPAGERGEEDDLFMDDPEEEEEDYRNRINVKIDGDEDKKEGDQKMEFVVKIDGDDKKMEKSEEKKKEKKTSSHDEL